MPRTYIASPHPDIPAATSDSIAIANMLLTTLLDDREEIDVNITATALAYILLWLASAAKIDPVEMSVQLASFIASECSRGGSFATVQ